jgi:hypothetical protein
MIQMAPQAYNKGFIYTSSSEMSNGAETTNCIEE